MGKGRKPMGKKLEVQTPLDPGHCTEKKKNWLYFCFRYEHLAKSAPTILDDSLSADSYLNILYMPSTFPRSERSRRSQVSANNNSVYSRDFEDGPRSNLDNVRYTECVTYLKEVSVTLPYLQINGKQMLS